MIVGGDAGDVHQYYGSTVPRERVSARRARLFS